MKYLADDGKVFDKAEECLSYEETLSPCEEETPEQRRKRMIAASAELDAEIEWALECICESVVEFLKCFPYAPQEEKDAVIVAVRKLESLSSIEREEPLLDLEALSDPKNWTPANTECPNDEQEQLRQIELNAIIRQVNQRMTEIDEMTEKLVEEFPELFEAPEEASSEGEALR